MFKKFVLPAVALAAITSCSSDEVLNTNSNPDGQDYISFNTVVGNNSRVTETEINTIKTDANGFYVVAYGDNSLYFNRSAAKYHAATTGDNAKSEGYYLDENYYWPSYELTFAAWYPTTLATENGKWDAVGNGLGTNEYVARPDFSDTDASHRHQINGYHLPTDLSKQVDIVIAREKASKPANNAAVSLNFRHIFSQIDVKANYNGKMEGDKPVVKVEVKGVALRYIPNNGTFTFPNGVTSTTAPATTDWSIDDTKFTNLTAGTKLSDADASTFDINRFVVNLDAPHTLTSDYYSLNSVDATTNNNFLVIPQNFEGFSWTETANANGAYLSVLVKISALQADKTTYKQIYPSNTETDNDNEYGWAAVGVFKNAVLKSLEPGTHYTINLTFTDTSAGKVDPDPIDPTPDKPGEDILGEPIWFSVDVAKWVENSQDINKPTTTPGA